MSRYKCIPLPFFHNLDEEHKFFEYGHGLLERYKRIEPIFNRYGMYLDRQEKIAWIETKHGCWQLDKVGGFFEHLNYISKEEKILHPKVVKALEVLLSEGMLPRGLRKVLYEHSSAVMCRHTYRSSLKWRIMVLGK